MHDIYVEFYLQNSLNTAGADLLNRIIIRKTAVIPCRQNIKPSAHREREPEDGKKETPSTDFENAA